MTLSLWKGQQETAEINSPGFQLGSGVLRVRHETEVGYEGRSL